MMKTILVLLFLALPLCAMADVTTQSYSVTFSCTGSTGPYSFTFPISAAGALTVTKDGTLVGSGAYTIVPVNNNYENGGKVTLNTACASGSTLVLARVTPLTQATVFTDNMPTPMKTFERSLDKLTEIAQEQGGDIGSLATWSCATGSVASGFSDFVPQCVTTITGILVPPPTIAGALLEYNGYTIDWQGKPYVDVRDFGVADMGGKVNAAYAALPASGGVILIPGQATCYDYSTPIVLSTINKYAILQGVGAGGGDPSNPGTTCLNYKPTTATTALTLDFVPVGTSPHNPGAGIRDLVLINNNCFTVGGCGSSATGVKIGVNNGGLQDGSFRNFKAVGFAVGIDHNVNSNADSWGSTCDNCVLESNGIGFRTTATEAFSFIGGKFIFNTTGVSSTNANLKFYSTHFDSLGTAIVANGGNVDLVAPHFENYPNFGTHYFTGTANLKIYGGDAIDDVAIGNTDYWFTTTGSSVIDGLSIGSGGRTVTNLGICSGACDWKFINSAPATLTAASVCPDSTAVNCEIIIPSTNTIKKSISELTIGGTGNTPNARLTVNYNSGTETGFGFTNKAASGRSWAVGDGVGAAAGTWGLYDVTGGALRFSVTAAGVAAAATVRANTAFSANGTAGASQTVVVKGSDGNNCNLVFSMGLLTSTTCP